MITPNTDTPLLGHEKRREQLSKLVRADRLANTILLAGPHAIGKSLVARGLAATILCENRSKLQTIERFGCGSCPSCSLVRAGNHPDLTCIDCDDREAIGAEPVRELLSSIQLKPFMSSARVVLLLNAEQIPIQSANILLKSFEEPRPGTYFILTASNPSRLPSTLLSRCQVWFFDALPQKTLELILQEHPFFRDPTSQTEKEAPISKQELATLMGGSLECISSIRELAESWSEIRALLTKVEAGDAAALCRLVLEHGAKKDDAENFLYTVRAVARAEMQRSKDELQQHRWATLLTNAITAERLAFDRNISLQYLAQVMLMTFMSQRASSAPDALLDRLVS